MNNDSPSGEVLSFGLSPAMLRKRASAYMDKGQYVEALQLLRQALERDPKPETRLMMGDALLSIGCYEQAARLMQRTLAHPDAPKDCWRVLMHCQQALGYTQSMYDCMLHYRYPDEADEEPQRPDYTVQPPPRHVPSDERYRRVKPLQKLALYTWHTGDRELALKRFNRAIQLSDDPSELHTTVGMLLLKANESKAAEQHLRSALRENPMDNRAACGLCVALNDQGWHREAVDLLRRSADHFTEAADEPLFITTALALHEMELALGYLKDKLRRMPHRIALLHDTAYLLAMQCRYDEAHQLWQRVLYVDPGDQLARLQLDLLEANAAPLSPYNDEDIEKALTDTVTTTSGALMAQPQANADALLQPGTYMKQLLDWTFDHNAPKLQRVMSTTLTLQDHGSTLLGDYLHELLMLPTTTDTLKQYVLGYLHQHGDTAPAPILFGQSVGMARPVAPDHDERLWPTFLGCFLLATRQHGQSMPMAYCAADWWRELTPEQQRMAAYSRRYDYVKAMEIFYLRCTEQHEAEMQVIAGLRVSKRRITRIIRQISPGAEPVKGEHHHEMYRL